MVTGQVRYGQKPRITVADILTSYIKGGGQGCCNNSNKNVGSNSDSDRDSDSDSDSDSDGGNNYD